jgi:hypothetical protein
VSDLSGMMMLMLLVSHQLDHRARGTNAGE